MGRKQRGIEAAFREVLDGMPEASELMDRLAEMPEVQMYTANRDYRGLREFLERFFSPLVEAAGDLDAEDRDAEDLDAEDLDAEDFDAEDFGDEEFGFEGFDDDEFDEDDETDYFDDDSPLGQAQRILDESYGASPKRQAAAARKALEICPECSEVYTRLAEVAATEEEALGYYRSAVEAAWKALGPNPRRVLDEDFGERDAILDYFEATRDLAAALFDAGMVDEAIGRYEELLDIDPDDEQEVRLELLDCLLRADRRDEVRELIARYEDEESPYFAYSAALLEFRAEGDTSYARKLLRAAKGTNRFVIDFLVGKRDLPREMSGFAPRGSKAEAGDYAFDHLRHWTGSEGAVAWVRQVFKLKTIERTAEDQPRLNEYWRKLAAALPQNETETWQVDAQRIAGRDEDDEPEESPWSAVATRDDDGAIHFDFFPSQPTSADVLGFVLQTMSRSQERTAARPGTINVCRREYLKDWRDTLASLGVALRLVEELPACDAEFDALAASTGAADHVTSALADAQAGDLPPPDTLPQHEDEIWMADVRQLATWMHVDGKMVRPTFAAVLDATNQKILMQNIGTNDSAGEEMLWTVLCASMARPLWGEPRRPGGVAFRNPDFLEAFGPRLAEFGVDVQITDDLGPFDQMVDNLGRRMEGEDLVGPLVDIEGIANDHLRSFYAAAARFRQARPWLRVPTDAVLQVERLDPHGDAWFGVIMGQSGMTYGLALYESLEELLTLMSGQVSDDDATRIPAMSLTFDEPHVLSARDVEAIERHGFAIHDRDGYPNVTRIERGGGVRAPLLWELEFVTACLELLADFEFERHAGTMGRAATGTRDVALRLEWL